MVEKKISNKEKVQGGVEPRTAQDAQAGSGQGLRGNEKYIKNEIERIKQKKTEYVRVTQKLLDKLSAIIDDITSAVEGINDFEHVMYAEGNKIELRMICNKFGTGEACFYNVRVNGHYLPDKVQKVGWDFYVYGDFNNYAQYMTREEILTLANNIAQFVREVSVKIDKYIEENKNALTIIPPH